MSDATEHGGHPDASVSGDHSPKPGSLPSDIPADAGPGLVGTELSTIKARLRDLDTDKTLPPQERDLYRLLYTHQRNKLQLQLAVLEQTERVHSTERAFEEARKAIDLARSGGRPLAENSQNKEPSTAENELAKTEESLRSARSELQARLASLEHLRADNTRWEKAMPSVRRWEVGRRWEAITPDQLRPAVVAIREEFDLNCWKCEQSTSKLCFAALHPTPTIGATTSGSGSLDPYRRFLVAFAGRQVQPLLLGADHPAPVIFKSYLDVYEASLKLVVRIAFQELFEIATARTDLLSSHPVEWTQRHLDILISAKKPIIRLWVKTVCDRQDSSNSGFSEENDIFWGSWRAPRLIHMQPAGNTPHDQASAWGREELVRSEESLEGRAERLTTFLRIDLNKIAGSAHIQFAKRVPSRSEKREEERSAPAETLPIPVAPPVAGTPVSDLGRAPVSAIQGSAVSSSSTDAEVGRRDMTADDPRNETLREAVIHKVQNPHKFKVLSVLEAARYFEVQPRTIYRWVVEGDLRSGARRGSITIESVLKLEKRRSRKRRDR